MAKYKSLKYLSSKLSMKCPCCGWYLKTNNNISWLCTRCRSTGIIQDLYKKEELKDKSELSDEWKAITDEK